MASGILWQVARAAREQHGSAAPDMSSRPSGDGRGRALGRAREWLRQRAWPRSGALSPLPALDGLRALAVLLVIAFHAWHQVPGMTYPGQNEWALPINYGRTGVQLFFVLSGFLLFQPYARALFGRQGWPSARLFYRRRALRVGPAYWVALSILVATAPLSAYALGNYLAHVVFLWNAFPSTEYSIDGVFWTMAIEVQFYAMLPLLAGLARLLARRVGSVAAIALVICGMMGSTLYFGVYDHVRLLTPQASPAWLIFGLTALPHWLGIFGAGMLCSAIYVYVTQVARLDAAARQRLGRGATLLLLTAVTLGLAHVFVPWFYPLRAHDLYFGWVYAGLLLGLLFGAPLLRRAFESRPARFIGLIAYSLYIWHMVVLDVWLPVILSVSPTALRILVGFLLTTVCSLPVAYLSFQLTERPFIRARKRAHEAPPAAPATGPPEATPDSARVGEWQTATAGAP